MIKILAALALWVVLSVAAVSVFLPDLGAWSLFIGAGTTSVAILIWWVAPDRMWLRR